MEEKLEVKSNNYQINDLKQFENGNTEVEVECMTSEFSMWMRKKKKLFNSNKLIKETRMDRVFVQNQFINRNQGFFVTKQGARIHFHHADFMIRDGSTDDDLTWLILILDILNISMQVVYQVYQDGTTQLLFTDQHFILQLKCYFCRLKLTWFNILSQLDECILTVNKQNQYKQIIYKKFINQVIQNSQINQSSY